MARNIGMSDGVWIEREKKLGWTCGLKTYVHVVQHPGHLKSANSSQPFDPTPDASFEDTLSIK